MAANHKKRISPKISFSVELTKGRDGYIVAECPDLPRCVTQGKTEDKALSNLHDVVTTAFALITGNWLANAKRADDSGKTPGRKR